MTKTRNLVTAAAIAASMLTGGVVGAVVLGPLSASAATTTPTPTATTPATAASLGTLKPNEDPTHEKDESAAREAQEDAGQMPTVP